MIRTLFSDCIFLWVKLSNKSTRQDVRMRKHDLLILYPLFWSWASILVIYPCSPPLNPVFDLTNLDNQPWPQSLILILDLNHWPWYWPLALQGSLFYLSAPGSWGNVIAWRSTTQNIWYRLDSNIFSNLN